MRRLRRAVAVLRARARFERTSTTSSAITCADAPPISSGPGSRPPPPRARPASSSARSRPGRNAAAMPAACRSSARSSASAAISCWPRAACGRRRCLAFAVISLGLGVSVTTTVTPRSRVPVEADRRARAVARGDGDGGQRDVGELAQRRLAKRSRRPARASAASRPSPRTGRWCTRWRCPRSRRR